jgi:lactoylglutathione lyase
MSMPLKYFLTLGTAAILFAGATPRAAGLRFDNVRLLVTRFDETFVFYRDVLGLEPTWGKVGENYASFAFPGGGQIALFKRDLMAAATATMSRTAAPAQDTFALILRVDDVDASYEQLRARDVPFVGPPQNRDAWGIRAVHFRDPDGNLIELFSALKK